MLRTVGLSKRPRISYTPGLEVGLETELSTAPRWHFGLLSSCAFTLSAFGNGLCSHMGEPGECQ